MLRDNPFILYAIFIPLIIGLVIMVATLLTEGGRSRKRRQISEHGATILKVCPICEGRLETGEVSVQNTIFRFKGNRKNHLIGAIRCTKCGHLELFTDIL